MSSSPAENPQQPRRFPARVALVASVLGLLAVGAVQQFPIRDRMEDDLTSRSVQALRAAGLSTVDVSFTGRDGSLVAGSAVDAERAVAIVRGLEGVRTVSGSAPSVPAPVPSPQLKPSSAAAAIDGGKVTLSGHVPSEEARKALISTAEAAYGAGNVVDQLTVDAGVSDEGLTGLSKALGALGKDAKGVKAQLSDGVLTLSGTVSSTEIKEAAVAAGSSSGSTVVDQLVVAEVQAQLIDLPPITFLDNSATLTADGQAALVKAAAILAANPKVRVSIEGHTDTHGSAASNLRLSQARAMTVLEVLVSLGVGRDRLTSTGYGESRLRVPDDSAANKALNRRVEFIVTR
jgi:outer membrane protein OmpA-like peptidoglycan-associated protein